MEIMTGEVNSDIPTLGLVSGITTRFQQLIVKPVYSETRSFDNNQIDLEELTGNNIKPLLTPEQQEAVRSIAEQSEFVSREVQQKKPRKRSPYIVQKNMKMRLGMPELLEELTKKIKTGSDQETVERALGFLIEQQGTKAMLLKYEKLTKDS